MTFTYKRRPFLMLAVIFIGFACAAGFVYIVLNDENLELRFLGFYAEGWEAQALAWLFAVFMAGLGLFGIYGFVESFRKLKVATLTATALIAPKAPISKKMITVPYADITKLQKEDVFGQVSLHVHHPGGKVSFAKSYLADATDFDTIQRELHARWDAATGVNVS